MEHNDLQIILDNGGGITVQCAAFTHSYDNAAQAADDVRELLAGADPSDWDGNEPSAAIAFTADDVRNGGYRVYDVADLRESINTQGQILCGWHNETDFLAALTGRKIADWTEEALAVGDRVEGGNNAEDYDTGRVIAVDGDQVTVAWDSGVRTTNPASTLRPEGTDAA